MSRLPLVADPQLTRTGGPDRPLVEVAVGVLLRADGSFLLTSRPAGKAYQGYWEFPGGKLESAESVHQALQRELLEEIGVCIGASEDWQMQIVDYPHALVRLHFRKVFSWVGTLQMQEAQSYSWQQLPVAVIPVLPGTIPVLAMLARERGFVGRTHTEGSTTIS